MKKMKEKEAIYVPPKESTTEIVKNLLPSTEDSIQRVQENMKKRKITEPTKSIPSDFILSTSSTTDPKNKKSKKMKE